METLRFILKNKAKAAIFAVILFSLTEIYAESVRICIWEGDKKPSLEQYKGKYRGSLSLVKWNRKFMIINTMDVEEYLFGVIGKEMDKSWPFEALKAQAICSRTLIYFYKEIAAKKNLPYDVSDTIYHQVYGGVSSENENIVKAVEETSNLVLAVNSGTGYNIIPTFFHACCGGHTNSASDAWGGKYPLLEGVEDPYCSGSPYYTWQRIFTRDDLKSILGLDVSSVRILESNRSKRAVKLEFQGIWGKKIIGSENFRMMSINGSTTFKSSKSLPSTMFTISQKGNIFIFDGKGYGHGVGLCQWGARRMAEEGKKFVEILKHYFPNLTLCSYETNGNLTKQ
ncbi:MAG: SpoIID/LytB domain-containing protein [Candidatus Omnitrophica bacterium]|nr:SpoIID/LytB domain-containing protein [Candidatus Omnitrophota bacterium]